MSVPDRRAAHRRGDQRRTPLPPDPLADISRVRPRLTMLSCDDFRRGDLADCYRLRDYTLSLMDSHRPPPLPATVESEIAAILGDDLPER